MLNTRWCVWEEGAKFVEFVKLTERVEKHRKSQPRPRGEIPRNLLGRKSLCNSRKMASPLPPTYVEGFHDLASVQRTVYNTFGDRRVSALSLGASSLAGVFRDSVTLAESCKVVEFAVRSGINLIDTAPWYGHGRSEEVLGEALAGIPRSAYYLHTKVGRYEPDVLETFDFSYERTLRSVDESLKRMRVDYIDTVQGACRGRWGGRMEGGGYLGYHGSSSPHERVGHSTRD